MGIDINKLTTVLKFADDTKLFGVCNNESDYLKLQEDVSKLESWALAWQMKFNVDTVYSNAVTLVPVIRNVHINSGTVSWT